MSYILKALEKSAATRDSADHIPDSPALPALSETNTSIHKKYLLGTLVLLSIVLFLGYRLLIARPETQNNPISSLAPDRSVNKPSHSVPTPAIIQSPPNASSAATGSTVPPALSVRKPNENTNVAPNKPTALAHSDPQPRPASVKNTQATKLQSEPSPIDTTNDSTVVQVDKAQADRVQAPGALQTPKNALQASKVVPHTSVSPNSQINSPPNSPTPLQSSSSQALKAVPSRPDTSRPVQTNPPKPITIWQTARVIGIHSGCEIEIEQLNASRRVVLAGVRCSSEAPFDKLARRFVTRMIFTHTVEITEPLSGSNQIIVRLADQQLLNRLLVLQGLAWASNPHFAADERKAKQDHRGIWLAAQPYNR